jgi:rSAM/selenodomain-associated transferase 1
LVVFARYPRRGEVKTRLASTIGREAAAEFYKLCAERVLRETEKLSKDVELFLFYADGTNELEIREWIGERFRLAPQIGADLGARMGNAFESVFSHGAQKAIIVGTDVPDLTADVIEDAFNALGSHELVVGPCEDGGYYLLGMKEVHGELFAGIPWSTDQVLETTLAAVRNKGLTVHVLQTLADVDTEEDLKRWVASGASSEANPVRVFARSLDLVRAKASDGDELR